MPRSARRFKAALAVAAAWSATWPVQRPNEIALELPPPPVHGRMSSAQLARALDAWLGPLAEREEFSGVVLVARHGREVSTRGYGFAERAARTVPTAETRFNIGSIGKVFTRVAVEKLAERGVLSRTDALSQWLPDYPHETTRSATIEQLLAHRGGVADIFDEAFRQSRDRFTSNAKYYELVSGKAPLFPPGEHEQYCNGCYVVLGEIVARASGRSFERFVEDQVLRPAGMEHTSFATPPSAARPYGRPTPGSPLQDVSSWHGPAASAAGGLYATAGDLLAFDNALREFRLLGREKTAAVLDQAGLPKGRRAGGRAGFAGGAPGSNALLLGDGEWTVVVLCNLDPPIAMAVGEALFAALQAHRDRPQARR